MWSIVLERIIVIEKELSPQTISIVTEGPQGTPGPPGPPGPPGATGSTYMHDQTAPAATWTIIHNLGTKPAVVLELSSNPTELIYTDVSYPDLNTVVVEWPAPETGKAFL